MYYRHIMALLPAALLMAACSDDNTVEAPEEGGAIQFTVSVPKAPRAVTTTENIQEFTTWAFAGGVLYMDAVNVKRTGENQWEYQPKKYWPAEALNFYSISPKYEGATLNQGSASTDISGFVSEGKVDLLYGVNIGETRADGTVNVNFRHALSQLQFRIGKESAAISGVEIAVTVNKVELVNVATKGSFDFPTATTAPDSDVKGEWKAQGETRTLTVYGGPALELADAPAALPDPSYIFALPQQLPFVRAGNRLYRRIREGTVSDQGSGKRCDHMAYRF